MQNDLQVWQLILDASWMVKMVMLILLAASVILDDNFPQTHGIGGSGKRC